MLEYFLVYRKGKVKIQFLSYPLVRTMPVYGNKKITVPISPERSLKKGDSCSTYRVTLNNHWGTHVDAPAHFFLKGKTISEYAPGTWIFNNPCVIKVPSSQKYPISPEYLTPLLKKKNDILILKTGFYKKRGTAEYSFNQPVISPETAAWMRKERPFTRAVGIDVISFGSYTDKEYGRNVHRAFLDPRKKGKPVLLVEDMDLSKDLSRLKTIIALPLIIKGVDSAPCTVLGVWE